MFVAESYDDSYSYLFANFLTIAARCQHAPATNSTLFRDKIIFKLFSSFRVNRKIRESRCKFQKATRTKHISFQHSSILSYVINSEIVAINSEEK